MGRTSSTPSPRTLNLLWFVTLSAPLIVGVALWFIIQFADYQSAGDLFPREMLWQLALGAMALSLLVARPLRNFIMRPDAVARRPLTGRKAGAAPTANTDLKAQAAAKVHTSMFVLLGMLDAVPFIIVAFSLLQADGELALLNGVYTLVLAVVAKPDFAALMRDTERALR